VKRRLRQDSHADVAAPLDLMRGLMLSVTAFMKRTGMTDSEIREIFSQCVSKTEPNESSRKVSEKPGLAYGCDTVAGAVLRAWHKIPKYVDSEARPISLRVDGSEPNLTSLILSQDSYADVKDVIQSMLKAKLLRRHGAKSYLPEKDAATIGTLSPLAIDHIAKTVMRLVETATRNVARSRHKLQLIERYAHVPDLTKTESKAFAVFSREQGQACLDAVEDWLEARQAKHARRIAQRKGAINAGVHIFAYLGEPRAVEKKVLEVKRKKRATSSPEARA
jgi:hypothetical protein